MPFLIVAIFIDALGLATAGAGRAPAAAPDGCR